MLNTNKMFRIVLLYIVVCWTHFALGQPAFTVTAIPSSDCPPDDGDGDGWHKYDVLNTCYKLVHNQTLNFTMAENYCKQFNGLLVELESDAENQFVLNLLHNHHHNNYWVGLTDDDDEDAWMWYSSKLEPEFTYWNPGEPAGGTRENCAVYAGHHHYKWDDYSCSGMMHPICEVPLGDNGNNGIIG